MNKNKQIFDSNPDEYQYKSNDNFNFLKIIPVVGVLERESGLLNDLSEMFDTVTTSSDITNTSSDITNTSLVYYGDKYNTFFKENCSSSFKNIYQTSLTDISYEDNIILKICNDREFTSELFKLIIQKLPIVLSRDITVLNNIYKYKFRLTRSDQYLYINDDFIELFNSQFHYYMTNKDDKYEFDYDNLINYTMMVKNGGDEFEQVLRDNLHHIDRWTILDTGSTDNTVDIINRVLVGTKKGKLFQEPFINFRESRNRCLDLAGTSCSYNLMLDDTYVVRGDLRAFLNEVRGDQYIDSFSFFIKSYDVEYYSNRITKSLNHLRYIYTLHEIIQTENNTNGMIPNELCHIEDRNSPFMKERTDNRKLYDLKCLLDMNEEDPYNSRHLYYIGQTYNLLKQPELAAEYFYKRYIHENEGFIEEKYDGLIEMTRLYNYTLNRPWSECEKYYKLSMELIPTRPEGSYYLGIHYHRQGDMKTAHNYFKLCFQIGYPKNSQYSLKPTLSYHFCPFYLAPLCYQFGDYMTGEQCSLLFLNNNKNINDETYGHMKDWNSIFRLLNSLPPLQYPSIISPKPLFCIVADGGFKKWSGKNILTTGLGGSETWAIETARYINRMNQYTVIVFCDCEQNEFFEGVQYVHLTEYLPSIAKYKFEHCIISRYSEYIPVTINSHVENIHVILHDTQLTGNVIPVHPKLKSIFCLSEWLKQSFIQKFTQFTNITHVTPYGIDFELFKSPSYKINRSFIYSSNAARGLNILLRLWPRILNSFPDATLHIFSDINNEWANNNYPTQLQEIKQYLSMNDKSVTVHGFVDKQTLATYWNQSDIWFYPCTFLETFCHTAVEAAFSKTLVFTNDLGGLQETVGDRGVVIKGDASTQEWQDEAFNQLCKYMTNQELRTDLICRNYQWASRYSWKDRTDDLLRMYIDIHTTFQPKPVSVKITPGAVVSVKNDSPNLNYADMFNWTNDLPVNTNAKNTFEMFLSVFRGRDCNILEIGTFAGTSVIAMLNHLPGATATTIDTWINYTEMERNKSIPSLSTIEESNIEEIFHDNVRKSNMTNRITPFKGDSLIVLIEFIKQNKKFDFIYVDGSHLCLDCYTDCVLSWQLLSNNGIMVIDDYLYKNYEPDILGKPLEGVNHFLSKVKLESIVLHQDYRVFIQKKI